MKPFDLKRRCMFCGRPLAEGQAREHVIPKWYLKQRGMLKRPLTIGIYGPDHVLLAPPRELVYDSLLAGKVCSACNSGWMSALEVAATPILMPLIEGRRRPADLNDHDRAILAKWACKSAYALDAASPGDRRVPSWHARRLAPDKQLVPSSVLVLGAISPFDVDADLMEVNFWLSQEEDAGARRFLKKDAAFSYKIALQLGRLVLLVTHWPDNRRLFVLEDGLHEAIWTPPSGDAFIGSRREVKILDGQHFLYNFAAALGLARSSSRTPNHALSQGTEVPLILNLLGTQDE